MQPFFPSEEYENRYSRARKFMAKRKIDALLATNVINYTYLGGHPTPGLAPPTTRPFVLVFPLNEEPAIISQLGARDNVRKGSNIKNIETWDKLPFDINVVKETLKKLKLLHGRIGCEFSLEERLGISHADFAQLQKAMPDAEFVDAADVFWGLRVIKTQTELECIRRACGVTSEAYEKTFGSIEPGMNPDEVQRIFFDDIARQGLTPHFMLSRFWSKYGKSMRVKKGGIVWLDGGSVYKGYRCDFSRMVAIEAAAENAAGMYTKMRDITWKLIEMVRPGLRACDIAKAAVREQKKAGVGNAKLESIGRIGHGLGLGFGDPYSFSTEPPSISLNDETILQPGMVITIEPGETTSYGYFTLEEDLVVTADGYELLSEEVSEPEIPVICTE